MGGDLLQTLNIQKNDSGQFEFRKQFEILKCYGKKTTNSVFRTSRKKECVSYATLPKTKSASSKRHPYANYMCPTCSKEYVSQDNFSPSTIDPHHQTIKAAESLLSKEMEKSAEEHAKIIPSWRLWTSVWICEGDVKRSCFNQLSNGAILKKQLNN